MAVKIGNLGVDLTLESAAFVRDLQKARRLVRSSTARMNRSMATFDRGMQRVTRSTLMFTKSLAALGASYLVGRLGRDMLQTGIYAERMIKGLEAATGSATEAARAQEFLKQSSEELGLVFTTQVEGYKRLVAAAQGTALQGREIDNIYRSIAEAATALQLSNQDVEGSLYAITQMISKGKVSMEELRQQLGERMPVAFQVAAEAMGMTTMELDKFISNGELLSEDFLPRFARALRERYSGAWQESAKTTQASINHIQNTWFELQRTVMESGALDAFNKALMATNELMKGFVDENEDLIKTGLPEWIDKATAAIEKYAQALKLAAQWPKYALAPSRWMREQIAGGLAAGRNVAGNRPPALAAAGIGAPGAYTPAAMMQGGAPFEAYRPDLSRLRETMAGGGAAAIAPYNFYRTGSGGPERGPMFDLQRMAEQAAAGQEIVERAIDEQLDGWMRIEEQAIESTRAIRAEVERSVFVMRGSFVDFFDATSEGFLDLAELVKNIAADLSRQAAGNITDLFLGSITDIIAGGIGGSASPSPWSSLLDPTGLSFDGGGYIGETVRGVGMQSGKSYEFHAGEDVIPRGAGGTVINNYISTLDAKSFKQAFGAQVIDINAQALNDNNQALWSSLGRRR